MFPQKKFQNVDILARIHGNVFPWQPNIMENKSFFYQFIFQISAPQFHLFFYNTCPRYLKSRRYLLYSCYFSFLMLIFCFLLFLFRFYASIRCLMAGNMPTCWQAFTYGCRGARCFEPSGLGGHSKSDSFSIQIQTLLL